MLPPNTVATMAARSPNRVHQISCPVGPASVRMPIISENSTSATSAEMQAFFRMKAMPGAREACSDAIAATALDFFDFRPAEQPGRKEDQHDDQNRKRRDVLVFDGEIRGPESLDQPDQQSAEHRARQRADAAQHRGG